MAKINNNKPVAQRRALWKSPLMQSQTKAVTDAGNAPCEDTGRKTPEKYQHHEYVVDIRNLTRGQLTESYIELKANRANLISGLKEVCDLLDANEIQIPIEILRLLSSVGISTALKTSASANYPEA